MTLREEERPASLWDAARSRAARAGSMVWIGVGVVLLAGVVYFFFAAAAPHSIDDGTVHPSTIEPAAKPKQ